MNEQIREFAKQAGFYKYGDDFEEIIEKFAKLIVAECADYFGREGDHRFEVDGNWIAKTIKQHFGVEE